MFCENCGKVLEDGAAFCPYCGTKANPASEQPAPPEEPVATVEPAAPAAPVEPVAQEVPVEPVAPVAPVEPVAPVAPVEPVAPAAPVAPVQQTAAPAQPANKTEAFIAQRQAQKQSTQQPPVAPPPAAQQPFNQFAQQPANPYAQPVAPAYPVPPQPAPKKSKAGLVIGIVCGVIAVAVIAVLAVIFIGNAKPEKKFYGNWQITLDYTEQIKNSMGDSKKYFDDDFQFQLEFDFVVNKDNTYTFKPNEAALEETKATFREAFKKAMVNALRQADEEFSDYSDEQIIAKIEKYIDGSFEDYIDEQWKEMLKEANLAGNFKADKEHFYLSKDKNHAIDENEYFVYEKKSSKEIVVTKVVAAEKSGEDVFPVPFTMKKVK